MNHHGFCRRKFRDVHQKQELCGQSTCEKKKAKKMVQKQKKYQEMVSSQDFSQSLVNRGSRLAMRSTLESATFHLPDGIFLECLRLPKLFDESP